MKPLSYTLRFHSLCRQINEAYNNMPLDEAVPYIMRRFHTLMALERKYHGDHLDPHLTVANYLKNTYNIDIDEILELQLWTQMKW